MSRLDSLLHLANGVLLLPLFSTVGARELRCIGRAWREAVSGFAWHDRESYVHQLGNWRRCFPNATACRVSSIAMSSKIGLDAVRDIPWISFEGQGVPFDSAALALFAGTESLFISDAQLASDIDILDLNMIRELEIRCQLTDDRLAHMSRATFLKISGNIDITDTGILALASIEHLMLENICDEYYLDEEIDEVVDTDMSRAGNLTDVSITHLRNVRTLRLSSIDCAFSSEAFGALTNLSDLLLENCPEVVLAGAGLAPLASAHFIRIANCPKVTICDADLCKWVAVEFFALIDCMGVKISGEGIMRIARAQDALGWRALHGCEIFDCPSLITIIDVKALRKEFVKLHCNYMMVEGVSDVEDSDGDEYGDDGYGDDGYGDDGYGDDGYGDDGYGDGVGYGDVANLGDEYGDADSCDGIVYSCDGAIDLYEDVV